MNSDLCIVYSSPGAPSGEVATICAFDDAYASRSVASSSSRSRNPDSSASSPRPGGVTWRWMRSRCPSSSIAPTSIGRVGGNGTSPACRWNPSARSASVTPGIRSGSTSMPRSTIPFPGSPGTAELPTCSTRPPGTTPETSAATRAATTRARGSHG